MIEVPDACGVTVALDEIGGVAVLLALVELVTVGVTVVEVEDEVDNIWRFEKWAKPGSC